MEYRVPTPDSSISLSNLESIGDSETEPAVDRDMVQDESVSSTTCYDEDDAESTSGDNSCATDVNVGEEMRRQMLCMNCWYEFCDVKQRVHDAEIIEGQRDSVILVPQEEAALAQDDAESNRLFWDYCIAHGY